MDLKSPKNSLMRITLLPQLAINIIVIIFPITIAAKNHLQINKILLFFLFIVIIYLNAGLIIFLLKKFKTNLGKTESSSNLLTYSVSITALVFMCLAFMLFSKFGKPISEMSFLFFFAFSGLTLNTFVVIFRYFLIRPNNKNRADMELLRLKMADVKASNLLLSQKMQPYFLLDALNAIKATYHKDIDLGDSYIVHLSNFLRTSISSKYAQIVRLEDEIKLLKDYLEIQKLRFGEAWDCIIILTDLNLQNYYLPGLTLQPLIENAIRHNKMTKEVPLKICIIQNGNRIIISNCVLKKRIPAISSVPGLANLIDQCRHWSIDDIIITELEKTFSVSIKLLEFDGSNHL